MPIFWDLEHAGCPHAAQEYRPRRGKTAEVKGFSPIYIVYILILVLKLRSQNTGEKHKSNDPSDADAEADREHDSEVKFPTFVHHNHANFLCPIKPGAEDVPVRLPTLDPQSD